MFIPYSFTWESNATGQTQETDGLVNLEEVKATRHTKDVDGESWEIIFGETQTVEVDKDTFDMIQKQLANTGVASAS